MIITVEVKPNARATKVIGQKDSQTFVVAITQPPTEGRANRELIDFLSKKLRVAKSLIEIKRGQGGRVKHVSLPDSANLAILKETLL